MDGWMGGSDGGMDGWMYDGGGKGGREGWLDEWMYGVWMDGNEGWFDGLMDGCLVSAQLALTFPTFVTYDMTPPVPLKNPKCGHSTTCQT